jgi:uncharacterized membrane protein
LILAGFILLYVAVFGTFTSLRHFHFYTQTWDMGAFVQTLWNSTEGRLMYNNLEESSNHLGVHMSPFLFFFVPIYTLFQSPYTLLIAQTIALAAGAIPLYLLALEKLKTKNLALLVAVGYLLYPALHWINSYDFHSVSFMIPLILAAFYFLETNRLTWMSFFLLLAALTREDAILVVMFFGIYLLVRKPPSADGSKWLTKQRIFGLGVTFLSFIYFLVSIKIIMPALGGGLLRLDRYAHLGSSFGEIAVNLITQPSLLWNTIFSTEKLVYFVWLFLPVAFLPLFSWRTLILLIPGLLENLLTEFSFQFAGLYQYDSVLVAGIFIGTIYGLHHIQQKYTSKYYLAIWVLAVAIIIGYGARSPLNPFFFPTHVYTSTDRTRNFRDLVKLVPETATVASHTNLVPHLSHREHSYMLGDEKFDVDIVLVDSQDPFGFRDIPAFQKYVNRYIDSENYSMEVFRERYFIFHLVDAEIEL